MSFRRTISSHGCASLAPSRVDEAAGTLETTVRIGAKMYTLRTSDAGGAIAVAIEPAASARDAKAIEAIVRRMFRLDQDLAPFYDAVEGDERLAWARIGAGRLMASPTLFEDVIKTICTTNCAWSATIRMTDALVALGGGAFPDAQTIASTDDAWFRDVARMGYRGPYVKQIAREVANGTLDLDALTAPERTDEDVEAALLALPGVGPYAAAHVMQLIGRHRHLVLDSWTRPTFLRRAQKKRANDTTIRRAFARYGAYAGLAFWLFLTREWIED